MTAGRQKSRGGGDRSSSDVAATSSTRLPNRRPGVALLDALAAFSVAAIAALALYEASAAATRRAMAANLEAAATQAALSEISRLTAGAPLFPSTSATARQREKPPFNLETTILAARPGARTLEIIVTARWTIAGANHERSFKTWIAP